MLESGPKLLTLSCEGANFFFVSGGTFLLVPRFLLFPPSPRTSEARSTQHHLPPRLSPRLTTSSLSPQSPVSKVVQVATCTFESQLTSEQVSLSAAHQPAYRVCDLYQFQYLHLACSDAPYNTYEYVRVTHQTDMVPCRTSANAVFDGMPESRSPNYNPPLASAS